MDRGKEYSLKKLAKLADNLRRVVELITLYNIEQDSISERTIGSLCERTRTAIINIDILQFLWPLIFKLIVLITN